MKSQDNINLENALNFDNKYTRELPADPESTNEIRQVSNACYSRVQPVRAGGPELVAYSREMAEEVGLSSELCESEDFVQVFSGNKVLSGMDTYATCYGGHQFGSWAGQLGDGRVINLGEIVNKEGRRWVLQLKGAGPTPYSRMGDGFAVLRSSIREFLCSEAMYHLGIPTTRALSLVTTGDQVIRDMFYDGNTQPEPGAIVCRTAPSFTRFGNFEILTWRGELDLLRRFADYTIRTDFPHLGEPSKEVYCAWFDEICKSTAEMIVHWQRTGFVHGVMNTDNMSILGLTIDYGPYGWLDDYDPDWTPNITDAQGRRYRFGNQAEIARWNLIQLANAIHPLIEEVKLLEDAIHTYSNHLRDTWQTMMADKLGLSGFINDSDNELIGDILGLLQHVETDMTIFFRRLAAFDIQSHAAYGSSVHDLIKHFSDAYYVSDQIDDAYKVRLDKWIDQYRVRLNQDKIPDHMRREKMNRVNPKYILRNYIAQLAIEKAEHGDSSMINELLEVLRKPYDEQPSNDELSQKRPEWARHLAGSAMLS
ncbi:MAG: YdiU family protein [Nitrospiraceae bacterium]|nr:MAG: YdiU family protein [Nitrospiraceae bacterium]